MQMSRKCCKKWPGIDFLWLLYRTLKFCQSNSRPYVLAQKHCHFPGASSCTSVSRPTLVSLSAPNFPSSTLYINKKVSLEAGFLCTNQHTPTMDESFACFCRGLGCQPSPWDPPSTSQTLEAQVNAYQQRVDDLQIERDACLARTTQMPPTTGKLPC